MRPLFFKLDTSNTAAISAYLLEAKKINYGDTLGICIHLPEVDIWIQVSLYEVFVFQRKVMKTHRGLDQWVLPGPIPEVSVIKPYGVRTSTIHFEDIIGGFANDI